MNILYLRDGDGGETSPRVKVTRCRNRRAKLPGGREQSEARRTQELSQPVERTNEAHTGGWNERITANRSLKIERDEAPDPDVQHVSG